MLKNIFAWVIAVCFMSCSKDFYIIENAKIGQVKSVLILGNSIVWQPPIPAIGWNGNWGMAASSLDNDFVHKLITEISARATSCRVAYKNIADFEQNYETFKLSSLDSLKNMNPDMIIMRIGENVNDSAGEEFVKKYTGLISYLQNGNPVIVITDGFWPKRNVNRLIKNFAIANKYTFIEMSDLSTHENEAKVFANSGVAMHPNDTGMSKISSRIWDYIRIYFK